MKTINYIFMVIIVLILISSLLAMFLLYGFNSKTISQIIGVMGVQLVLGGIAKNFFIKDKEKDERNIAIENRAKAKAFDVTGIIFGILIISYWVLKNNLIILLLAIVAYIAVCIVYMAYLSKYHKEM